MMAPLVTRAYPGLVAIILQRVSSSTIAPFLPVTNAGLTVHLEARELLRGTLLVICR